MDPITIGTAIAVLAGTKAVEVFGSAAKGVAEEVGAAAGAAGWSLAEAMLLKVKEWFSLTDREARDQLEAVEETDDATEEEIGALAALIDERLPTAPLVEADLSAMLEAAKVDPVLAPILASGNVTQSGRDTYIQDNRGDHNTNIGSVGGDFNLNSNT